MVDEKAKENGKQFKTNKKEGGLEVLAGREIAPTVCMAMPAFAMLQTIGKTILPNFGVKKEKIYSFALY